MPINESEIIEQIVSAGLASLKNCLWDDPECYWPQEGENNGLPERNLSMHVGHMFLKKGWNVFVEASYPGCTDRRLDLLALRNRTMVACECKQLDMADRAIDFAKDASDLQRFRLTGAWDSKEWQAPTIDHRYGLLLAVTWSSTVKEWWTQQNDHQSPPKGFTGPGWKDLGKQLCKFDATEKAVYGKQWLNRSDNGQENFWALFVIAPLHG